MQVVNPTPAAIYTGIGNAIATISRVEGYLSLWRGLSSVVLGAGDSHELCNEITTTCLTTTLLQVPPTPFTLRRTNSSSKPWEATPPDITQWLQVRNCSPLSGPEPFA